MRRRLSSFLTAALVALAVLLPAVPAAAADTVAVDGAVVLASEGHVSTDGLDPMSPNDEDNEFAPANYDPNWTWRAGKVLLAAFLFVVLYLGLMYYLRVVRPAARSNDS